MAAITCPKCGIAIEVADDGTHSYDFASWAYACEQAPNGTPFLCPHLKAAIEVQPVKSDKTPKRFSQ